MATGKKRLEIQAAKVAQSVATLDQQARQALTSGRDDLARAALERKKLMESQLQSLDAQRGQLQSEQDKLVLAEKRLAAKLEAFRSHKEAIKARYTAAEAQLRIGEAFSGVSEEMADVGLAIERAEGRTEAMQARAGALDELLETGTLIDLTADGDAIDRQLRQVTAGADVNRELEAMKRELGMRAERGVAVRPAGQLGEAGQSSSGFSATGSTGCPTTTWQR